MADRMGLEEDRIPEKEAVVILQSVIFQQEVQHRLQQTQHQGSPYFFTPEIDLCRPGQNQQVQNSESNGEPDTQQNRRFGDAQGDFGKQIGGAKNAVRQARRQHTFLFFSHGWFPLFFCFWDEYSMGNERLQSPACRFCQYADNLRKEKCKLEFI